MQTLTLTSSWREERQILSNSIRNHAAGGRRLRILEAGCGRRWDLKLDDTHYVLTGVDLDPAALDVRVKVAKDLDEAIVGDLRSVQLPENGYDVIYCSYVLEHIARSWEVMENFIRWLHDGGLLIIQVPDPHSVKGFVTRLTPHWFHVFYYRHIQGIRNAGTPGHGPYRTHYEQIISRQGMREFCDRNGLSIETELGCGWRQHGPRFARAAIHGCLRLLGALSLGRLASDHDDLTFIIRKSASLSA